MDNFNSEDWVERSGKAAVGPNSQRIPRHPRQRFRRPSVRSFSKLSSLSAIGILLPNQMALLERGHRGQRHLLRRRKRGLTEHNGIQRVYPIRRFITRRTTIEPSRTIRPIPTLRVNGSGKPTSNQSRRIPLRPIGRDIGQHLFRVAQPLFFLCYPYARVT